MATSAAGTAASGIHVQLGPARVDPLLVGEPVAEAAQPLVDSPTKTQMYRALVRLSQPPRQRD